MSERLNRQDGVGGDAYGMIEVLLNAGYDAVPFTSTGASESPWQTYNYADTRWKLSKDDLLIYHYGAADEPAAKILRQLNCRVMVRYHSIPPSKYMAPYSEHLTREARAGRMMIEKLADLPLDCVIANSESSLREFRRLSSDHVKTAILPIFTNAEELVFLQQEPATVQYVGRWATNILCVGRLVPEKGHADILEAFASYLRRDLGRPHLHLVGSHDAHLASYTAHLSDVVARNAMTDAVSIHPTVSPSALASYYRQCDLFWTGSRHEGFCVPTVEAMAFGLPILSTTAGSLPKTCGDAAIYADNPIEMAAALETLLSDDELFVDLRRRGRRRYETLFHRRNVTSQFLAFIERWVASPETPAGAAPRSTDVGDWFGLPDAIEIVKRAIAAIPRLGRGLYARDRRLDLVFWIVTEGVHDASFASYVRSDAFQRYAETLGMPPYADHFAPDQRLIWTFSRKAQEVFPLHSRENVASFNRWYKRGRQDGDWS